MVGETGFEPKGSVLSSVSLTIDCGNESSSCPHIGPQIQGADCPKLAKVIEVWVRIPDNLKQAILLMIQPFVRN